MSRRIMTMLAMAVTVLAGSLVVAAPARAAGAVHIQNVQTGDCVDQHFNSSGAATITVYAWPDPCHAVGNQNWVWEAVGSGWYRVVNNRWDPATGLRWCLSAPENAAEPNRVYAEYCRDGVLKQRWSRTSMVSPPSYLLRTARDEDMCMAQSVGAPTRVYVDYCWANRNNWQFRWVMTPA